jgi:hypothetical protein
MDLSRLASSAAARSRLGSIRAGSWEASLGARGCSAHRPARQILLVSTGGFTPVPSPPRVSFAERNLPPRQPTGPRIPEGVRKSILAVMHELGFTPTNLFGLFSRRHGYGSMNEVIEDLQERFSDAEATDFQKEMMRVAAEERRALLVGGSTNPYAEPALLVLPEALFLDAIECGFAARGGYGGGFPETKEINALFERRGIYFRVDARGRFEWVGDPGAWKEVTEPALSALQDPRLAGARNEFEAARAHLRKGSSKDVEDTIEEAAKAVESAMKFPPWPSLPFRKQPLPSCIWARAFSRKQFESRTA